MLRTCLRVTMPPSERSQDESLVYRAVYIGSSHAEKPHENAIAATTIEPTKTRSPAVTPRAATARSSSHDPWLLHSASKPGAARLPAGRRGLLLSLTPSCRFSPVERRSPGDVEACRSRACRRSRRRGKGLRRFVVPVCRDMQRARRRRRTRRDRLLVRAVRARAPAAAGIGDGSGAGPCLGRVQREAIPEGGRVPRSRRNPQRWAWCGAGADRDDEWGHVIHRRSHPSHRTSSPADSCFQALQITRTIVRVSTVRCSPSPSSRMSP